MENDKINRIKSRLQAAFSPEYLSVIDESDQHRGHTGHQGGNRHFLIELNAQSLKGLSRIEAHRRVFDSLQEMMIEDIHALRIKIVEP